MKLKIKLEPLLDDEQPFAIKEQQITTNHSHFQDNEDKFVKIHDLIQAKKQTLQDKQKMLKKITHTNHFLNDVVNDYNKYYQVIIKQKQDQVTAMNILNEYLEDLAKTNQLSKNNIEDSKAEQVKILRELKHIQDNLDALIDDTNNVSI